MLVSEWNTSLCGSLTLKSRFALESVLRKPMSETPSMSAPSSRMMLPEDICSFNTLAGTLVVIHAGSVVGLKPSSSTLYPLSTAENPSFAMPEADGRPLGAGVGDGAAGC